MAIRAPDGANKIVRALTHSNDLFVCCVNFGMDHPQPLRILQVFVSPRQRTDHWRHCRGGRQALVNIKSAPPAIPFDTPVAGMGRAVLKIFPGPGRSEACIPGSDETPQLVLPCSLLLLTSQLFNFFNCAWV